MNPRENRKKAGALARVGAALFLALGTLGQVQDVNSSHESQRGNPSHLSEPLPSGNLTFKADHAFSPVSDYETTDIPGRIGPMANYYIGHVDNDKGPDIYSVGPEINAAMFHRQTDQRRFELSGPFDITGSSQNGALTGCIIEDPSGARSREVAFDAVNPYIVFLQHLVDNQFSITRNNLKDLGSISESEELADGACDDVDGDGKKEVIVDVEDPGIGYTTAIRIFDPDDLTRPEHAITFLQEEGYEIDYEGAGKFNQDMYPDILLSRGNEDDSLKREYRIYYGPDFVRQSPVPIPDSHLRSLKVTPLDGVPGDAILGVSYPKLNWIRIVRPNDGNSLISIMSPVELAHVDTGVVDGTGRQKIIGETDRYDFSTYEDLFAFDLRASGVSYETIPYNSQLVFPWNLKTADIFTDNGAGVDEIIVAETGTSGAPSRDLPAIGIVSYTGETRHLAALPFVGHHYERPRTQIESYDFSLEGNGNMR